jgi:TatD DNase family protein
VVSSTGDDGLLSVPDSHCHLADDTFAGDLGEVVARARAAGVPAALCILSAGETRELARAPVVRAAWPAVQFAAAVHPHAAAAFAGRPAAAAATTRQAIRSTGARAVGEIGLDYHYDFAPRAVQQDVLRAQVALALELDLPVVIHTREAADDTLGILREAGPALRGVMHCFSGTRDEARHALDLGFYLSLSGILTFPKANALRELVVFVPSDRLLVETDAPFLAPVPHRGRRNEPAWVTETARVLATARGEAVVDLAAALRANFATFLGLDGTSRATSTA